jgi:hypothetical protein
MSARLFDHLLSDVIVVIKFPDKALKSSQLTKCQLTVAGFSQGVFTVHNAIPEAISSLEDYQERPFPKACLLDCNTQKNFV